MKCCNSRSNEFKFVQTRYKVLQFSICFVRTHSKWDSNRSIMCSTHSNESPNKVPNEALWNSFWSFIRTRSARDSNQSILELCTVSRSNQPDLIWTWFSTSWFFSIFQLQKCTDSTLYLKLTSKDILSLNFPAKKLTVYYMVSKPSHRQNQALRIPIFPVSFVLHL